MDPTNKIHDGTHDSCEKEEYAFIVFREYLIIFQYKEERVEAPATEAALGLRVQMKDNRLLR